MTTVNLSIELPEQLAEAARKAGLLTGDAVAALLAGEVRRRNAEALRRLTDRAPTPASAGMTEEQLTKEINEEVQAVRAGKRADGAHRA